MGSIARQHVQKYPLRTPNCTASANLCPLSSYHLLVTTVPQLPHAAEGNLTGCEQKDKLGNSCAVPMPSAGG